MRLHDALRLVGKSWRAWRGGMTRPTIFLVLVAALTSPTACDSHQQLHGVMIEPPRDVAAFEFVLPSGETFRTAPEPKRPMLLFFGYTHCPDVCPTTMADWTRAKAKLGAKGARVRFVFVSVDPERDTPTIADQYAKQFDASFVGVSGNAATTAGIMKAFGVSAAREPGVDATHYFVGHSGSTFLVDSKGRLVAMYPLGIGWDALVADLETLRW